MDIKEKILLGEEKNVNSINEDYFIRMGLMKNESLLTEYNIKHFIDLTKVFEEEREKSETYRIYGTINYLSLLNGLVVDYEKISDIFQRGVGGIQEVKDIFNSFDIYLLRHSSDYGDEIEDGIYQKRFDVLSTPNDINIMNAGYNVNIFNEDVYYFDISLDFNIEELLDGLHFPITDFYLYFQYKPDSTIVNGVGEKELLYYRNKNTSEIGSFDDFYNIHPLTEWNIEDCLYDTINEEYLGEVIKYDLKKYKTNTLIKQRFKIKTLTKSGYIYWEYNPFIPIKLRHLSSGVSTANRYSKSYEQANNIPYYAVNIDNNGNVVWRDILPDGLIDPITNDSVNHPFVNNKKYVFNNIILSVVPDLTDNDTITIFEEIKYNDYVSISKRPINVNIDNIGKPCQ